MDRYFIAVCDEHGIVIEELRYDTEDERDAAESAYYDYWNGEVIDRDDGEVLFIDYCTRRDEAC